MKKLITILFLSTISLTAQIQPDKYYHAGAGTVIAAGTHFSQSLFEREMNPIAPSLMAFTAGFSKEMFDCMSGRKFSGSDLIWTTASGIVTNAILRTIYKPKPKKYIEFENFNPPLVETK